MSKFFCLIFTIYFLCSGCITFAQYAFDKDSLETALQNTPKDSTKVEILVNLWRVTAYNDTEQSVIYARKIIDESKEIGFETGEATGYQRLGISFSLLGINDSILYNYYKALSIYKKNDNKPLIGVMLYNIGLFFQDRAHYDSAIFYINLAGELFKESNDNKRLGAVYEGIGSIEQERGNYRISLQNFLKASNFFIKYKDSVRFALTQLKIGDSYFLMKNINESISYYQDGLNYFKRTEDKQSETDALIKLGAAYHKLGDYAKAEANLKQGIEIADQLSSSRLTSDATSNLGISYFEREEYEAALPLFERSLTEARKADYTILIGSNLINLGWIYFYKNDLKKAMTLVSEGYKVAQTSFVKENIKSASELLSKIYEKTGDYKRALFYHSEFKAINDSLYNSNKSAQIAQLQTLYETEKKENEIAFQKEEIKVLNQKARINRLRKQLLEVGLVAVIITGLLIFYGFRQKIKRINLEKEQEKHNYQKELTFKKKELTTHTLHLVQKNELLEDLKERLVEIRKKSTEHKNDLSRLVQLIKGDKQAEKDWENFKMYFEQVHENFDLKLREKFNDLTSNEMRLAALMKMNLTTKEIATVLNISPDSVNKARYRLRKKLNLSGEDSLTDFILAL